MFFLYRFLFYLKVDLNSDIKAINIDALRKLQDHN